MNCFRKIKSWILRFTRSLTVNSTNEKDFQEPYIEQSTVCDNCKYLNRYLNDDGLLDITLICDTQQHYIFGLDGCQKWRYISES